MQENRSFDSYFGTYPGADGIDMSDGLATPSLPDPAASGCVRPYHDGRDSNVGGPHRADDAVADIDGGRMDGFVRRRVGEARSVACCGPEPEVQRAPARPGEPGPGLGDPTGRRAHARARLAEHGHLRVVGRLGRFLRPRGPAHGRRERLRIEGPRAGDQPYARTGYIDQTLSFDAYLTFIEDVFLGGERLDPLTDGRPDSRPTVRETVPILGDLSKDFDFSQPPRPPLILPPYPCGP
jgi:Phosphoesterase family